MGSNLVYAPWYGKGGFTFSGGVTTLLNLTE
jgi:hypothetical protein